MIPPCLKMTVGLKHTTLILSVYGGYTECKTKEEHLTECGNASYTQMM